MNGITGGNYVRRTGRNSCTADGLAHHHQLNYTTHYEATTASRSRRSVRPCLQFSCYYDNQPLLRPVGTATPGNLRDSHLLPLSASLSRASFSSFGPSNLSELAFSLEHGISNKEVAETGVTLPFAFLFLSPSVCRWVVIIGGSKERES